MALSIVALFQEYVHELGKFRVGVKGDLTENPFGLKTGLFRLAE